VALANVALTAVQIMQQMHRSGFPIIIIIIIIIIISWPARSE